MSPFVRGFGGKYSSGGLLRATLVGGFSLIDRSEEEDMAGDITGSE